MKQLDVGIMLVKLSPPVLLTLSGNYPAVCMLPDCAVFQGA
jgi:hypothetical protein